ncbi:amidohydrolase [Streptomyces sp. NPDC046821]|uniref:amidohydrolase n=1 Tax=Streptomyces sp. NPDC046821 TaxID=3154702 RepID=UPI0033FF9E32
MSAEENPGVAEENPGATDVTLIRNVRPWGGEPSDIHIADGRITRITRIEPSTATPPHEPASEPAVSGTGEVDGRGLLALPGLVNVHAHVDKTWWGGPWVSYQGDPSTPGRIAYEREHRDALGIPGVEFTAASLREFVRHGTTALRTHVDVDLGLGLRGIEVVREALDGLGGAIEAQIVAFPQDGVLRRPGVVELLEKAAKAGAHYIGGLDPATIDRDPAGQLDAVFAVAERHGVGVDVHLHDGGELGAFQIELIVERTLRAGLQGKVTVAHGFAVGQVPPGRQQELVAAMGEAGVTMSTVAPLEPPPLPIAALKEAGVVVGLGTDGVRDLWTPYGTGDLLAVATTMARLSRRRDDGGLEAVARMATSDAAGLVGRDVHDLVAGARADVVLVDAENIPDTVTRAPERALVVSGGRVVAHQGEVLV